MKRLTRRLGVVAMVGALACSTEARQQSSRPPAPANADGTVLQDFKGRVEAYAKLRDRLEDDAPEMKETKDPAKINAAQKGIAVRIRDARKDAKPGDIFTPEIRSLFRRLLYPETKGSEGESTKAAIEEDKPSGVSFKVNAPYPEKEALPTMPPNLLASLPPLPEDLEYRIVGKHLILRDVDANIIVDYIPNVIR